MASVVLKNVSKNYSGGITAVRDFSLEVEDGEFLVLVGPSGCGKSTTLRMIAGLEEVGSGEIYIDGKLVNNVKPRDRDIAMVFQNYALYPHLSVFDNMAFGLKQRKYSKDEIRHRVEKAAAALEIDNLLNRRPRALSGGQKQRVALGRAIVRDPKVFLMDEPLSNLDAKLRAQMRVEIAKLHKRLKTTIIYVTHDQTEAMTMGSRIVVMRNGVIQQADEPTGLFERPANSFVAGFIGMPAMNQINTDLVCNDNSAELRFNKTIIRLPDRMRTEALQKLDGKKVILGIRPGDLFAADRMTGESSWPTLDAEVEIVEKLGAESYLNVSAGGDLDLIVRAGTDTPLPEAGSRIKVAFNPDKIYLFDHDTGEAVLPEM